MIHTTSDRPSKNPVVHISIIFMEAQEMNQYISYRMSKFCHNPVPLLLRDRRTFHFGTIDFMASHEPVIPGVFRTFCFLRPPVGAEHFYKCLFLS